MSLVHRSRRFALAFCVLALAACSPTAQAPSWTFAPAPGPSTASAVDAPAGDSAAADDGIDVGDDGDDGIDPTAVYLSPSAGNIQIYPDRPSVLPGQALRLHTSTSASRYALTITREGSPERVVFTHAGYTGRDYRSRVTRSPAPANTVRANWPVSVSIPTTGWRPGVYTVYGRDSNGRTGGTIFVVRSAAPDPSKAMYVLSVMDYQAYNGWGGSNFYTSPLSQRAMTVSWDRPYNSNGGLSFFPAYDRYTIRWLERHGYPLTYTTDYDLATNPPTTAPRVMILGQHTEYVNKPLFDYVDEHVNIRGDMNIAYFGANSFYWQVRMSPDPRGAARPQLMTCYKLERLDPIRAAYPELATVRWRDPIVDRPESGLFGSQYVGIASGGHTPLTMGVTAAAPAWALAGTGWLHGTLLRGLLLGETDGAPAGGGTPILTGNASYNGTTITGQSTVYTSPAGARVFDAGTFAWGKALGNRIALGVPYASFDRFNRNLMAWLSLTATR